MKKKLWILVTTALIIIGLMSVWTIHRNSQKRSDAKIIGEITLKSTVQKTTFELADDFRNSLTEDEYTKHTTKRSDYKLIYFTKDHLNKEEGAAGESGKWIYAFLYDQSTSKQPSYLYLTTKSDVYKTKDTHSLLTKETSRAYIIEADSKALKKGHYSLTIEAGHISLAQYQKYKEYKNNRPQFKDKVTFIITLTQK